MQGGYYQEAMGMKSLKCKPFLGAKGEQSCTGQPISPFPLALYSVVHGNSRTFATNPSSVQRLH